MWLLLLFLLNQVCSTDQPNSGHSRANAYNTLGHIDRHVVGQQQGCCHRNVSGRSGACRDGLLLGECRLCSIGVIAALVSRRHWWSSQWSTHIRANAFVMPSALFVERHRSDAQADSSYEIWRTTANINVGSMAEIIITRRKVCGTFRSVSSRHAKYARTHSYISMVHTHVLSSYSMTDSFIHDSNIGNLPI